MIPMTLLPISPRYAPSKETVRVLNGGNWEASFSGGKDSTAVVSWVEYLRRVGMITVDSPRLVMSDTGVEYPFLRAIAGDFMEAMRACGWECEVVTPPIHKRLYPAIFGRGVPPTHPGNRKGRWCTQATKLDPMQRHRAVASGRIGISGVRYGESESRDKKLMPTCAAGGECGLPQVAVDVHAPLLHWTTCKVIEWLAAEDERQATVIPDLIPLMRRVVNVYDVSDATATLFGMSERTTTLRFGCIGCPAISTDKVLNSRRWKADRVLQQIRRVYGIWRELYKPVNRCVAERRGKWIAGPIRMPVRQRYFSELMAVQNDSGVTLVTPEEADYIRECWRNLVYPRGWSAADELNVPPPTGLFAEPPQ